MTPPRVVLDTNAALWALVFTSGSLSWIRESWRLREIAPLVSRASVSELIRALNYPKFGLNPHQVEDLLSDYLPWCESVIFDAAPRVPECRDRNDERFLELAGTGNADALVTGDRDLLALKRLFSVTILTPDEFRQLVEKA